MSDAAATDWSGLAARNGVPRRPLSREAIDKILSDFRGWLEAHGSEREPEEVERIDMQALVAQFTALRHEVNLQTKASRSLAEQATKLLEKVDATGDEPKPLVKAFLDIADVLAVSLKQMEKLRETAEPLLESLVSEPLPEQPTASSPGFFARLLGSANHGWSEWASAVQSQDESRREATAEASEKLLGLAQAAADGYAMSLRRVERAFPELDLEPIECVGCVFDPEAMEVVEVGGDGPAGTVTEELRRGYRCKGRVVRYAQVRVAR